MRSFQICLKAKAREKKLFGPSPSLNKCPLVDTSKTNESSPDIRPPLPKTNVIPFVRKCISQVLVN